MSADLKQAVDALFSPESDRIGNVKFFRGRLANVTAEQLLEELKSANLQIKEGHALPISVPAGS